MLNNELVVDADSHWSEPADLFTSRAPAKYVDRVPHVELVDGERTWVFDGKAVGRFSAGGVIARDGTKESSYHALFEWTIDEVHDGAYDPKVRLEVLDECGIDAQVIFPSTIGLGGQGLGAGDDPVITRLAVEIYNDAMAEIQAESGNRLLPMPLMPAWNIDECVREAQRVAALGARGVNMTSDPRRPRRAGPREPRLGSVLGGLQRSAAAGALPHRGERHGDDVLRQVPVGVAPDEYPARHRRHVAVHRQRPGGHQPDPVGRLRPPPGLKTVSVESGVGWIPFILETLDYEMAENAPQELAQMSKMPSEYFKSNIYATFWFENNRNKLPALIESVGEDSILFETDFPHPTCLYPNPLETVKAKMATLPDETRRKIMGENARKLYRL